MYLEEKVNVLEKELAELKVILHQLRNHSTVVKGLTVTTSVEDTIEFEGKKYKKVDRLAREGDVVIFNGVKEISKLTEDNTPYAVMIDSKYKPTPDSFHYGVYEWGKKVGVDVYELIEHQNVEDKPKTINELRGEIIEKAKVFVESDRHKDYHNDYLVNVDGIGKYSCEVEFVINERKCTVAALLKGVATKKVRARGIAKCMSSDVFNAHIGKAIALGRALGLDVSEFEQAVQPTFAIGQKVYYKSPIMSGFEGYYEIEGFNCYGDLFSKNAGVLDKRGITIINDTNAIYGGNE